MEEKFAYCGLACHACDAFEATRKDDDQMRKQVAKLWSKIFKQEIKPEEINCNGCTAQEGVHFKHCGVCEIRKCAQAKSVENCGLCRDYPCPHLDEIFKSAPDARTRLDAANMGEIVL